MRRMGADAERSALDRAREWKGREASADQSATEQEEGGRRGARRFGTDPCVRRVGRAEEARHVSERGARSLSFFHPRLFFVELRELRGPRGSRRCPQAGSPAQLPESRMGPAGCGIAAETLGSEGLGHRGRGDAEDGEHHRQRGGQDRPGAARHDLVPRIDEPPGTSNLSPSIGIFKLKSLYSSIALETQGAPVDCGESPGRVQPIGPSPRTTQEAG
jgi:hypothetical protein